MDDAHDLVGREQLAALLAAPQAVTVAAGLADRIMTAIAVGEFQPGQRLPAERELSALLGVSRSTVRDALSRVAARGLLEIRRGRSGGAYVASQWSTHSARAVRDTLQPQWKELEQAFDMRRLIEALVASTAAQRRDGEDEERIAAALVEYETAPDLQAAQRADLRLHEAVARAAKNPRLLRLHDQLLSEVSIGFAVEPFTPKVYARALPEHRALADAVIEGDSARAWQLGSEHFNITEDELRQSLERALAE